MNRLIQKTAPKKCFLRVCAFLPDACRNLSRQSVRIFIFLSLLVVSGTASAEGVRYRKASQRFSVLFRINEAAVDTLFLDNEQALAEMSGFLAALAANGKYRLDSISLVASASQDGRLAYNIALSERRARSAARLVRDILAGSPEAVVTRIPIGEDWETFRRIVEQDPDFPSRSRALEIIGSGLTEDRKERELKRLPGFFRYLLDHHVHKLRAVHCIIDFSVEQPVMDRLPVLRDSAHLGTVFTAPVPVRVQPAPRVREMIFALRTNLLVPALNVGLEVPVGDRWSVGADYYYPWWLARGNDRCVEMLAWFLDARYWLDPEPGEKLTGHAVGAYAGFGYYDFQWLKSGWQGEFIDIGVDYTYALPVARNRLRLEFNIGLGWIHTVARHYTPTDGYEELIKDPGIRHERFNFFGPTRASVSLVVPIRVNTERKGGAR